MQLTWTTRSVTQTILLLLMAVSGVASVMELVNQSVDAYIVLDTIAVAVFGALLVATRRGWRYTGPVLIIFIILCTVFGLNEPYLSQEVSLIVFIAPAVAMVLAGPRWILASAIGTMGGLIMRGGEQSVYLPTINLLIFATLVGCLIVGWLVANTSAMQAQQARKEAEQAALALQEANSSLEQRVAERTAEVQANMVALQHQSLEQARLLEQIEQQRQAIRGLSVPVIPVSDQVMVMPLVGELDAERLTTIHTQALQSFERNKARILAIDVTGVPLIDTQIAQGLMRISQAARLLGGSVILVGIRPEVAQTIVSLGMDVREMLTASDLKSALSLATRSN